MPHPGPAPDAKPPLHGRHICDVCNQSFVGVPAYIDPHRLWACPLCFSQAVQTYEAPIVWSYDDTHIRLLCKGCGKYIDKGESHGPCPGRPFHLDPDLITVEEFEAAQADWLSTLKREWPTIQRRIAELERKVERLEHPVGGIEYRDRDGNPTRPGANMSPPDPQPNTVNLSPHVFGQSYSPPPPPASRG